MQRDADSQVSNNDRTFIIEALVADCRVDGRGLYDYRKIRFEFSPDDSSATLTLGTTRVTAVITGALEAPYPDRPSEGAIRFNVECGPMASPAFEAGRPGPDAVQLARLVERALKQSGAVDCEALCVIAGRKVWSLRCDVHVLDHGGNLVDACVLAALAAVMAYRKPEVTVGGDSGTDIIVHPREHREPVPLTIHHTPVSVTWALFQTPASGTTCVLDPSLREQAAQAGSATLMVNTSGEVCGVHKAEGLGLTAAEVMRLVRLSCDQASTLVGLLKDALQAHEVDRVAARVRRVQRSPFVASASRHVSVSAAPGREALKQSKAGHSMDDDNQLGEEMSGSSQSDDMSEEDDSSDGDEDEDDREEGEEEEEEEEEAPRSSAVAEQDQLPEEAKQPRARLRGPLIAAATAKPASAAAHPQRPVESPKAAAGRPATPNKRLAPVKLEDNLETIAALIAGRTSNEHEPKADLDLTAAIKPKQVQKKKKT